MQKITIDQVLNQIKTRHELKSDYAVCKHVGLSTQVVSNWRHGRSLPDEKMAQRLAEAAGIDADVLIAQLHAYRAKDDGAKAIWERIAQRLQLSAQVALSAVFAVTFAMGFVATDARAAGAGVAPVTVSSDSISYTSYLVECAKETAPVKALGDNNH